MKRENAVDDRVDGLAVGEGVFDEADVACCGCGVEAEVGDWRSRSRRGTEG